MKTIAVIFGGRSAEHDISIITGLASIIKPLELTKSFKVEAVYVAKDGRWFWDEKLKDISLFTSGKIQDFLSKSTPVSLQFDNGLNLSKGGGLGSKKTCKVDVVFPALHGTFGEDGSLMGLLEMAGVPYVGCPLDASVISMDKILAKQIVSADGVKVAPYHYFDRAEFITNQDETVKQIEKSLAYPLFVKPAHLGSSIGITRVTDRESLINAIEVATHYDDKVLVEQEIPNLIEVTLPVMGNDELIPALLEKPLTTAEDFFDFETKYMQGGKKGGKKGGAKGAQGYSQLPADIPEDLYAIAEETGLSAYKALGCKGIARIDMLIDGETKEVYFNEANPLPGSLYSHNWRQKGITSVELVTSLIQLAEERFATRQEVTTSFNTNYLQQF